MASEPRPHRDVRYEPDDRPPLLLTTGLGLQYAMLAIAGIIITPTVMISTAGGSDAYLTWAVFAALVVSGIATMVQALRIGRIGAGYILVMGSTGAFLAVSVSALEQGRAGTAGKLGSHVVPGPVCPRRQDVPAAQDIYAHRRRHRAHADPGYDRAAHNPQVE